jgi:hypothetical protein
LCSTFRLLTNDRCCTYSSQPYNRFCSCHGKYKTLPDILFLRCLHEGMAFSNDLQLQLHLDVPLCYPVAPVPLLLLLLLLCLHKKHKNHTVCDLGTKYSLSQFVHLLFYTV